MRRPPTFQRWMALFASFCVLAIAFSFGLFSLPAFYPVLIKEFGWSHAAAAGGGSIVLLLIGAFSPVVGWLVDKYSPKAVLLAGIAVVALALALLSLTQSLAQYYAFCLLLGIGTSAVSILPNSILIAPWFSKGRASAVGLINAGIGVGGIGPLLANSQFNRRGAGGTFLYLSFWLAIPFVLTILAVRRAEKRQPVPQAESRRGLGVQAPDVAQLVRMPMFWIFGASVFFAAHAMLAVQQNLVLYLRGEGVTPARATLALSLAVGASAFGKILSGAIADKASARLAVMVAVVAIGLGIATLLTMAPGSDIVYLFAAIFGIGYGGIFNATPTIVFEYFGTQRVGAVMGLFLVFFGLGTASGGLLAGYLFDRTHSYVVPFTLDLALATTALLLLLMSNRQTRAVAVPSVSAA